MRQVACLSLDGGGLLALSELFILQEIMQRLQCLLNLPTLPLPCDHFDVIGGSGSGGLIAILLGRLRLSMDQTIEYFLDLNRTLHCPSLSHSTRSESLKAGVQHLVQSFTPNKDANEAILEYDPKCKMFVCAMPSASMTGCRPECFRNYKPRKYASWNCKIWEAARATVSHRSFFDSIRIGPCYAAEDYVDACFGFNNPTELVMEETKSLFPPSTHRHLVLSLGASHPGISSCPLSGDEWGFVLEEIATDCERTANRIAQSNIPDYFRLNVSQSLQGTMLQDWADLGQIASHTKQYMASSLADQYMDQFVQVLARRHEQVMMSSNSFIGSPPIAQLISRLPHVDLWDFELDQEIVIRHNYRFYIGRVHAERRVLIQTFYTQHALEQRDQALRAHMVLKHPNLLAVYRKSDYLAPDPSIFFSNEILLPVEQRLSRALESSDTTSLVNEGMSLVASLASGLNFLETKAQHFLHATVNIDV
ncbi:acyl transferase/acyl hydrolase/lysophospholipase [Flagelloscypha sp. PMI_526]|nr:acyl transferase/acyl hydrolase/lysophospholipase [Flagelloscypha sp. PMI_526]